MNLNKKLLVMNVLASLVFADAALARIEGVRSPSEGRPQGPGGGGKPLPVKTTPGDDNRGQVLKPDEVKCSMDQESATYFPQSLIKELSKDGSDIKFSVDQAKRKIVAQLPPMISVCGDFKLEAKQNVETKNVTLLMYVVVKDSTGKETRSTYKQFEECLAKEVESKKILENGKINHDDLPGKFYSSSKSTLEYEFDRKKDVQKSVSVTFGYPEAFSDEKKGYPVSYGIEEGITVPQMNCMKAERIAEKPVLLNKGKEDYIRDVSEWCQNGRIQDAADLKKTIGNADALKDIASKLLEELDAGYLSKAKAQADDILKSLAVIEKKYMKDQDGLDDMTIKKIASEYAKKLEELDKVFLNPAINRVEDLMIKRKKLMEKLEEKGEESSPEIAEIDKEIKILNEEIGRLAQKSRTTEFNTLYSLMDRAAATEQARTIVDIVVKSRLYSKVYEGPADGREKALTFESAKKEHANIMRKEDLKYQDWNDLAASKTGNTIPYQKAVKTYKSYEAEMIESAKAYTKIENELAANCQYGMTGGLKNQSKCNEFWSGRESRAKSFYKKREQQWNQLNKVANKVNKYSNALGQYQDAKFRKAQERAPASGGIGDFDEDDSSFGGGLEASSFGSGSMQTQGGIVYNPNSYSMGAGINGQIGQAQMYNMNGIGQQGQGQYMLQGYQQGGGAWPSM